MTQSNGLLENTEANVFPHPILHSALFHGGSDALSRTPTSAGNGRTWTFRACLKGADFSTAQVLFDASADADNRTSFYLDADGCPALVHKDTGSTAFGGYWDDLLLDPTGHYDIVLNYDSTQATAADRTRLTVNGKELTKNSGFTEPALNKDSDVFSTVAHGIGRYGYGGTPSLAGYLSDACLIDGSALPASTWGAWSDLVTGLWVPRDPDALPYGTNGCRLAFDNAIDLGADSSGNGNHWTVAGVPVQTMDTPTNNGCVLNALDPNAGTLSNGNLTLSSGTAKPTLQPESGRWSYKKGGVEQLYDADVSGKFEPDLAADTYTFTGYAPTPGYRLLTAANLPYPTVLKSATVADIVLREGNNRVDYAAASLTTSSSDPARPATNLLDGDSSTYWRPYANTGSVTFDFGAGNSVELHGYTIQARNESVAYAPGSVVVSGSDDNSSWTTLDSRSFGSWTYSEARTFECVNPGSYRYHRYYFAGGAGYPQVANLYGYPDVTTIDSLLFTPDKVMTKARNYGSNWGVVDSKRGDEQALYYDRTDAEAAVAGSLSIIENGFELGSHATWNRTGYTFIDLCLKAGPDQGFDIATWTGDDVVGRQIQHSLGTRPTVIIVKCTSANGVAFVMYHATLGAGYRLGFDTAAASPTAAWDYTEPTATTFTVGNTVAMNGDGLEYVAYLFADSDVFKTFSYTGNGAPDGPFVNLGGRPLKVWLKNADTESTGWVDQDAARNPANTVDDYLKPNSNAVESSAPGALTFTAQGFKVGVTNTEWNNATDTIVGVAVIESAGKYANAF